MQEKPLKNLNDFVLAENFLRKTAEDDEESVKISHDVNILRKKFSIVILAANKKKPDHLPEKNNIVLERKNGNCFTAYWKEEESTKFRDIQLDNTQEFEKFLKRSKKLKKISDINFVEHIAKQCGYTMPTKYKNNWFDKIPAIKTDMLTSSQEVFVNELKRLLYPKQMKSRTVGDGKEEIHFLSKDVHGKSLQEIITDYQQQGKIKEFEKKFQHGIFKGLGFLTLLGQFFKDIDLKFSNIFAISNRNVDSDLTEEEEEFDLVGIDGGCNLLMGDKKDSLPFFGRAIYIKSEMPEDISKYVGSYIFLKNKKQILYVDSIQKMTFFKVNNEDDFNELVTSVEKQDEDISLQQNKVLNKTNQYLKIAEELIVANKERGHDSSYLRNLFITKKSLEDLPLPTYSGEHNWLNYISDGNKIPTNGSKKTPVFLKEENQAILRILMLPTILANFIKQYASDEESVPHQNKLIERINELKQAALQTQTFCKYLISSEAKPELEEYLDQHLLTFVTVSKNNLVAEADRSEVRATFLEHLSSLQNEKNKIEKEKKRKLDEDWPKGCPKFFKNEFDIGMQALLEKKEAEKMSYLEDESQFVSSFEEVEGGKRYFAEDIMDESEIDTSLASSRKIFL